MHRVISAATFGIEAEVLDITCDAQRALPAFIVAGLPEGAVRESRERILAAIQNTCVQVPPRRIMIEISPLSVRKDASTLDLAIAAALLGDLGLVQTEGAAFIGELFLDGDIRAVRGVLPMVSKLRSAGVARVFVPRANAAEASIVDGIDVIPVSHLADVLSGAFAVAPKVDPATLLANAQEQFEVDFADVKGQEMAKRAIEIAVAGGHNILLSGVPGAGKSMLARRIPSIMPPLSVNEALELTRVHSVAGRIRPNQGIISQRPFRAPHHTISDAGLVGGGSSLRPGEVSLAHTGVLFLDELPEFRRHVLDSLRHPITEGVVVAGRGMPSVGYPSRFMLVAAMNPCPCGFFGSEPSRCICHRNLIERYQARIPVSITQVIDMRVDVPVLRAAEIAGAPQGESSAVIRERVAAARRVQSQRFIGLTTPSNAHMDSRQIREHCVLDEAGALFVRIAIQQMGLSAQAYHHILRVARTIADLAGQEQIAVPHLAEAVQFQVARQPEEAAH